MTLLQRRARREAEYVEFVAARGPHLRRIAYAICGDWHLADDLLQDALVKLYVAWPRVQRHQQPEAYVRQILVRVNIDEHRRRQRRVQTVHLPEGADAQQRPSGLPVEERSELVAALQQLPEMQRKTVVMRHWLGLSVEETATELGIGKGTVKSHTSRALANLRERLSPSDVP